MLLFADAKQQSKKEGGIEIKFEELFRSKTKKTLYIVKRVLGLKIRHVHP